MISAAVLYVTAMLMGLVAVACTVLCIVWTVPAWRRRLARAGRTADATTTVAGELSGLSARVGSWLVSAGIAACAAVAWYGLYCTLAAV